MKRSKQTIALERLKEIGKATLKVPNSTWYLSEDLSVVVAGHQDFFLAVAPHTKRLNPASLSIMGKDLFQMASRESKLFGESLAAAYSHCITSGSKATTGEKIPKEVFAVYQASCLDGGVKQEATEATIKSEQCSPPPKKSLRLCLSSPSQIAAMYAGSSSSVAVKVMGLCAHDKHKHTGCINMCPSAVYQHTARGHKKMPP